MVLFWVTADLAKSVGVLSLWIILLAVVVLA
jgi:hypothetical protein